MRKMKENACNNKNQKKNPGFLLSAVSSNSGKTAAACGLMSAFKQEGKRVYACKCGPDYIDPMFHREVLGVDSKNLDLFFSEEDILKEGYLKHTKDADITITEGVMGFYDGMSLDSVKGSSYDVAQTLGLPVILVINARGAAMTLVATVKGIVEFRPDSNIRGILLNRVSAMLYPRLKEMLENELARIGHDEIKIVGYIPENEAFHLESRHLGLMTAGEVEQLDEKIRLLGETAAETADINAENVGGHNQRQVQTDGGQTHCERYGPFLEEFGVGTEEHAGHYAADGYQTGCNTGFCGSTELIEGDYIFGYI